MLTEKQLIRMQEKLERFEKTLEELMFQPVDRISMSKYQTEEGLDQIPADYLFTSAKAGDVWGGEKTYCWFKGRYQVPDQYDGKDLYLRPNIGGYEAMMWINGIPHGIFTSKIIINSHGNHYCDLMKKNVSAGEYLDVALEYYSFHYMIGTQPFMNEPRGSFTYTYEDVQVCLKNEEICDFYFDLKTVNQMVRVLDENSFRRADLLKHLYRIHEKIYYDYENADKEAFMGAIRECAPILKEVLAKKNSETVPYAGLIGHSHMDTAWLWHQGETLKKCARTYANQMNLMEQYPEYTFIQSSAYHGAMIKEHYPELFEQIRQRVKEGRYEPNGGVWIECDCNIPSGESIVRQFVWGQRFTKENFDYYSDCFWLPDTFGYSVSLPQIMKGCRVRYFLTTKMGWNDTNEFPYDTFWWKGLDGSQVLVHLNRTHIWPDPETLKRETDFIKEKTVSDMRLLSYGFGDGGGGPQFEMIEMARRVKDTEGLPRAEHTTVSRFMKQLEERIENPTVYSGELYLELHRGTLTNKHTIKRNNRLAEIAIHNLELVTVLDALEKKTAPDAKNIRPLVGTMLKNQFHDILPGTCIPLAHQEAIAEMNHVIAEADHQTKALLEREGEAITITNSLSFDRHDVLYLDYQENRMAAGEYRQQIITDVNGNKKLAVAGVSVPAFASVALEMTEGVPQGESVFTLNGDTLTAPLEQVRFNEKGYMESYVDLEEKRELRGEGYALNTLLVGEEVSRSWDCWDVDADFECRLKDQAVLLDRQVVADGPVELRIRSRYRLTEKSSVTQDMIFYADTKEVRFETLMDWQDEHRFLKTAFDTSIFTDVARQEVQFGYIKRSTTRNTSEEKAKFEVSNHKYTDLSETRYGAALLNDCKYGISVEGSSMHLSLHKGGCRPDYTGDKGLHYCCYAFLPHQSGFDTEHVIRPAYLLNVKQIVTKGAHPMTSLLTIDTDHVIAETVKPTENGENAFVVRLYEAEGTRAVTGISVGADVKKAEITNMLEEEVEELADVRNPKLSFRPFEIKTVKWTL